MSQLTVIVDGRRVPESEARDLWTRFSAHMDAHRGDFAGFAAAEGYATAAVAIAGGTPTLTLASTAPAVESPRPDPEGGRTDRPHRGGPAPDAQPRGAQPGRAKTGGAKPGGAKPGGAKPGGAKPGGAKPGGAKPGGAKPGGAKPGGAKPGGRKPRGAKQQRAQARPDDGHGGNTPPRRKR